MNQKIFNSETPPCGLNPREVLKSRELYGENTITKKKRKSFMQHFISSFGDPVIKILLIVLAVNVIVMFRNSDWYEIIGIALSILLSTTISTVSEYGSESAFLAMQQDAETIRCKVRRAGKLVEIPVKEIVVGDLVVLQAGERVPADGIMVSGKLSADQSSLNGESKEALKTPGAAQIDRWDVAAANQLFFGTTIVSGEGVMLVKVVGDSTLYGGMVKQIQEEPRESPLKYRLTRLTQTLSRLGYAAAGLVFLADLYNALLLDLHYDVPALISTLTDFQSIFPLLIHALTLGITVIVVSVPEGLPMMITVVLSANMKRMLKNHVLVRKLVGIETSGSLNILFTDKTGTLTQGKLRVNSFISANGVDFASFQALHKYPALQKLVALSGLLNTSSTAAGKRIIGGNYTDQALFTYAKSFLSTIGAAGAYTRSHVIPFDSDYKFSSVQIERAGESYHLVKGAPEIILTRCTHGYDENGRVQPLSQAYRLNQLWRERTRKMERVLALAVSPRPVTGGNFEGLILIGLVCIRDDIRPEAAKAVQEICGAGIQMVMVTGDNQETAQAVAAKIGLLGPGDYVVTSTDLAGMDDREIIKILPKLRVVARALPADKSRLVALSQQAGLVVGMTGDGINDAPALKKADVGFAMGTGTEVAKEAGDIVILNNNISAISKSILYGRTVFKNIRKFVVFQLTMNLCAVGVSLAGPFIGIDTPVTVIQMLWINMIMDTLGGLAFSGEAPLAEYMKEPPKKRDEPILNRYMGNQILFTGAFTMTLCIFFLSSSFFRNRFDYTENPAYFLTAFFALFIFCGVFNSFNARTHRLKLLSGVRKNPVFLAIMTMIVCIQLFIIYRGGELFRSVGLSKPHLLQVISLAALVLLFDLLRKIMLKLFNRPRNY